MGRALQDHMYDEKAEQSTQLHSPQGGYMRDITATTRWPAAPHKDYQIKTVVGIVQPFAVH